MKIRISSTFDGTKRLFRSIRATSGTSTKSLSSPTSLKGLLFQLLGFTYPPRQEIDQPAGLFCFGPLLLEKPFLRLLFSRRSSERSPVKLPKPFFVILRHIHLLH